MLWYSDSVSFDGHCIISTGCIVLALFYCPVDCKATIIAVAVEIQSSDYDLQHYAGQLLLQGIMRDDPDVMLQNYSIDGSDLHFMIANITESLPLQINLGQPPGPLSPSAHIF